MKAKNKIALKRNPSNKLNGQGLKQPVVIIKRTKRKKITQKQKRCPKEKEPM